LEKHTVSIFRAEVTILGSGGRVRGRKVERVDQSYFCPLILQI
jgi:hypothetical protein